MRPCQAQALGGEISLAVWFEELVLHWFVRRCGGGSEAWKTHTSISLLSFRNLEKFGCIKFFFNLLNKVDKHFVLVRYL